jgi:hypothetical protein
MKKAILICLLVPGIAFVQAQAVYHYDFEGSLDEKNGKTPSLTALGTEGSFVTEIFEGFSNNPKMVYRFDFNCGLEFDNIASGHFLGGTYTIELYFVMDDLAGGWRRVLDYKNRKTDWGLYVINGKIQFVDIVTGNEVAITEGIYSHLVVTRNDESDLVQIYFNGVYEVSFTDSDNDAVLDEDNVLHFFQDDLEVPDDASPGAVALLKVYDYEMTPSQVFEEYQSLENILFSVPGDLTQLGPAVAVFPNPADRQMTFQVLNLRSPHRFNITLSSLPGQVIYSEDIPVKEDVNYIIPVHSLEAGVYILRVTDESASSAVKVVVR